MTDLIKAAFNNCNPEVPLQPDDPRYMDLTQCGVRGSGHDPVSLLRGYIRIQEGGASQQFFTGFRGCGKTTELYRLRQMLEQDGYQVVYVDSEEYLNLRVPADLADIWIVIAASLDQAVLANRPVDEDRPFDNFWERLTQFFRTRFGVGPEATVRIPEAGDLKLTIKTEPGFRARLYKALGDGHSELVRKCREYVDEALAFQRRVVPESAGTVLILDSFEKLRGDLDNGGEVRASIENIFIRQAGQLRTPCHAVFTIPPWVRFMESGPDFQLGPIRLLPMCRITHKDGEPCVSREGEGPSGIDAMVELIGKRVDIPALLGSDETIRVLAAASGGYPRDLLNYLREVLIRAYDDASVPIPVELQRELTATVVQQKTREFELAILDEVLPLLVRVALEHDVRAKDSEGAQRVAELFDHHFVLAYKNGEEWFDLHPLVRRTGRVQQAILAWEADRGNSTGD
jgi:hypothetical protein